MLLEELLQSNYTVVFTGAGMSTESGLRDFRSNKGWWKKYNPQELSSVDAMNRNRSLFTDFYRERIQQVLAHEPHEGHHILANWQKKGIIQSIITQNVDGYHQKAMAQGVVELHGTLSNVHCSSCGEQYDSEKYAREDYHCDCGDFLRPSIVLFGEMLDEQEWRQAFKESEQAELFLVLGSSLEVSPANQLPLIAKKHGARVGIINMDPTVLDEQAHFVIQGEKISRVLHQTDVQLWSKL